MELMRIGEGNGNPLQYSCLGNPLDRGVWWATRYSPWGSKRVRHDLATKQKEAIQTQKLKLIKKRFKMWPWQIY